MLLLCRKKNNIVKKSWRSILSFEEKEIPTEKYGYAE